MANDLNMCLFVGRVGKEIDLRYTPNGAAVASFSIAVGKSVKGKDEKWTDKTEWIPCVAWRNRAEFLGKYAQKGTMLRITGEFTTRKWKDREGQDRYTSEIIVSDVQILKDGVPKESQQNNTYAGSPASQAGTNGYTNSNNQNYGGGADFDDPVFNPDEEVPF